MRKGIAENLVVKPGRPETIYRYIKDAREAGVRFYCCSPSLDLFDMSLQELIPECSGIIGCTQLIEKVMEDEVRVLSY